MAHTNGISERVNDIRPDSGAAFRLLKESLGSLMYIWCRLEDELASVRKSAGIRESASAGGFSDRLLTFRRHLESTIAPDDVLANDIARLMERIDAARTMRNLIVHGLTGIDANPAKGEPHLMCEQMSHGRRSRVTITQSALAALLQQVDNCRRDLGDNAYLARKRSPHAS
jgi:hypothetical protein